MMHQAIGQNLGDRPAMAIFHPVDQSPKGVAKWTQGGDGLERMNAAAPAVGAIASFAQRRRAPGTGSDRFQNSHPRNAVAAQRASIGCRIAADASRRIDQVGHIAHDLG
jgi:hypothetical protein